MSLLQAKAETEISKAQKLISEKDAELLAAEEMLSELVEVYNIRYLIGFDLFSSFFFFYVNLIFFTGSDYLPRRW